MEDTEPLGAAHTCRHPEIINIKRVPPAVLIEPAALKMNDYEARTTADGSGDKVGVFRKRFYPHISDREWNNWRWQIKNRITTISGLERIMQVSDRELSVLLKNPGKLPFSITPYYAALLDPYDEDHALRRTVVPASDEHLRSEGESDDPLNEDEDSPIPGLVHRYPDRVLFLVTDFCSTYCRYCTRSRMVGKRDTAKFTEERWSRGIEYIEKRHEIRDVLLSGGDPLTLSDERLEWLLSRLRRIPHVEIIRIGTKVPVVLPQRITPNLVRMLKRYHPLWISIHFTHPDELTYETKCACAGLADYGIPLQSQTVLLSGVNDNPETMKRLMHGLVMMRVRPYYLYQCDPITGSAHFRTPVRKGIEIIKSLRGYTSGFAVPLYVIDAPGGGGKVPIMPDYIAGRNGDNLAIRNYEDHVFYYHDSCKTDKK